MTRTIRMLFPFGLLLAIGLATSAEAQLACRPLTELEDYLRTHPQPANVDVLALNHRTQEWSSHRWDGHTLHSAEGAKFGLRLNNRPRIEIARTSVNGLRAFVIDTNPLLYLADVTEASAVDSQELANIKKLASALGGNLSQLLAFARRPTIDSPVIAAAVEGVDAAIADRTVSAFQTYRAPEEPTGIDTAAEELIEALTAVGVPALDARRKLASAAGALTSSVSQTEALLNSWNSSVQLAETGRATAPLPAPTTVLTLIGELMTRFTDVESTRSTLSATPLPCNSELATVDGLVRIALTPPADGRNKTLARQERNRLNAALRDVMPSTCSATLGPRIDALANRLRSVDPGDLSESSESLNLDILRHNLQVYATLAADRTAALATTQDLLAKRESVLKTAASLLRFSERADQYLKGHAVGSCTLTTGVIEVDRLPGPGKLERFKIRQEGFKVAADPALQGKVQPLRRSPLEAKFELIPRGRWQFDADFGLIYTDLASPEFGAVEVSSTDEAGQTVTRKVVARVDEDVKAGQVAIFGTVYPKGWPIGLQLGAAIDTKEPALLGGLAVRLGPYVKLSGGVISSKVNDLARGFEIGDTVPDADSIRTHDEFDEDWYVALSVTLDNLPFFGGG